MKMNHRISLRSVTFVVAALCAPFLGKAQSEAELAELLRAHKEDASELIGAYMSPVIKGISYGMSQGWYHTAKAHKTLGFDLGVSVHVVNIPRSDYYFDPNKFLSPYTDLTTAAPNGKAPTIVGPDVSTTYTSTYDPDGTGPLAEQSFSVNGPEGLDMKGEIGMSAVIVPMAQLGIGIIKNTDLKIRFVPKTEFGSSELQMLGFGVMHDIKQHIPGIKLLPFDLSALVAFNSVKGATGLEGTFNKPSGYNGPQEMNYKFNSWVIQALISKKFSVLTLYAGAGYAAAKTTLNVVGEYEIPAPSGSSFVLKNPVALKYNDAKTARLTGGLRLKFGPLYLNGEYTLQKYNTYSVGLGFSVR